MTDSAPAHRTAEALLSRLSQAQREAGDVTLDELLDRSGPDAGDGATPVTGAGGGQERR